jgi:hypothetical protein
VLANGSRRKCPGPARECNKIAICSFHSLQQFFRLVVSFGYAMVMTSEALPDNYFYLPRPWCSSTDRRRGCWNGGDNPDVPYFGTLFDAMHTDTLVRSRHPRVLSRFAPSMPRACDLMWRVARGDGRCRIQPCG